MQDRYAGQQQRIIDSLQRSIREKNEALTYLVERFGDNPVDDSPDALKVSEVFVVRRALPAEAQGNA